MELSAFKPFFSFPVSNWSPKFIYGLTHAYNRTRADNFNSIKQAIGTHGELLLGQIPITNFHEPLVKKLAENGLVVSCNDNFELSGVGSLYNIIPPYSWTYYDIDHQHLPFTNSPSQADPDLIISTLEKMSKVYNNKGSVYVHCKDGNSRSAFIIALFLCVNEDAKKQKIMSAGTDQELADILINAANELKSARKQVCVEKTTLTLGVGILKRYVQYWNKSAPLDVLCPLEKETELNAYQILNQIAQSDEYKFVWSHAYKKPNEFPIIKEFAEAIYSHVERNIEQKFNIDDLISVVALNMKKDKQKIILDLHGLYLQSVQFVYEINKYSNHIQGLGFDLLDKIIKSDVPNDKKTSWLKITTSFLKNPNSENLENYNIEIQNALIHPSLGLQIIGGTMIALGAAVIIVSFVAAALATGGFLGVALATFGGSAFGAFQIAMGSLIYEHGLSDHVARASQGLVADVLEYK